MPLGSNTQAAVAAVGGQSVRQVGEPASAVRALPKGRPSSTCRPTRYPQMSWIYWKLPRCESGPSFQVACLYQVLKHCTPSMPMTSPMGSWQDCREASSLVPCGDRI